MQYSIVFGTFLHLYIISYHFYISMHICLHTLKFKYARSKVQVTSVVQRVTMCYNVSGPVGTLEAGSILTFHPKLPGHMGSWRARRTDMAWQASNAISAISAIAFIMFEYGFMFVWSLNVWQEFVESFARLYPRLKKVLRTSSGTKPCDPLCQGTWQNEYVQFESIWHQFDTILPSWTIEDPTSMLGFLVVFGRLSNKHTYHLYWNYILKSPTCLNRFLHKFLCKRAVGLLVDRTQLLLQTSALPIPRTCALQDLSRRRQQAPAGSNCQIQMLR